MAIVYKIINLINMKAYIGVTSKDMDYRMALHKHSAFKLKSKSEFYKSIREFGWNNFAFSEIEHCGILSMYDRERHWIKELNTMWPNGYNTESSHLRSDENNKTFQSEIVKEKKSIAQKIRFSDESERKRQSRRMKKMFKDPENKEKHRQGLINSWTDERREQYRKLGKENKNLINAKGHLLSKKVCSKPIELFDNETKEVHTFESAKDACRFLNVSLTTVSQSIYRGNFISKRYLAKYKKDKRTFNEIIEESELKKADSFLSVSVKRQGRPAVNKRSIKLKHSQTNEVLIFKSVKDAAKHINRQTTNISYACKEKGRVVAGYFAEYIDTGG